MTVLLIISTLLMAAALGFAGATPSLRPVAAGLALVLLVLAGIESVRVFRDASAGYSPVWDQSVGYTLGRSVAGDGIREGTILILDQVVTSAPNDLAEARLDGFLRGIESVRLRTVRIDATDLHAVLDVPGIDPDELDLDTQPVDLSTTRLLRELARHPDAAALVSFAGLPAGMSSSEWAALPPTYVYGLDPETAGLAATSPPPSLRALVHPSGGGIVPVKPEGKEPAEIFSERFVLVRP